MHVLPAANGVSALLVVSMATPPSSVLTSQAQPEPNWPTAASLNFFWKSETVPKARVIASASAPDGSPPPLGDIEFQKKVWFQTCAALLKYFFSLGWL